MDMKFWILLLTLLPSVAWGNDLFQCSNALFGEQKLEQKLQASPTWTWPGDLATHLRTTHGANTAGMSHQQMVDYHSHLHNTSSITFQQSNCPGGVCPTPQRYRFFRRRR